MYGYICIQALLTSPLSQKNWVVLSINYLKYHLSKYALVMTPFVYEQMFNKLHIHVYQCFCQ